MREKQVNSANFSPLNSCATFINSYIHGLVPFPRSRKGEIVLTRWGKCRVWEEIAVEHPGKKSIIAIFMVSFHLKSMFPRLNTIFLRLSMPFIAGLPGFRTKLWMFNDGTGDFQGLHEWITTDDALAYAGSFAARFMKRRSFPGSAEYSIVDGATGAEVSTASYRKSQGV